MAKVRLVTWIVLLALSMVACRVGEAPNLLDVVDVSPRRVEVGDHLEVVGSGFPEGKRATVTFRGTLHRPGSEPEPVELVAVASSTSQNRIAMMLDDELHQRFCGTGPDADHTTFRGDVIAAFAPRGRAAPPVTGTAHDIVLDFSSPIVPRAVSFDREAEGRRALEFAGVTLDAQAPPGGLSVAEVTPGGRAARAGIEPEDTLTELDGLILSSVTDFIPSSRRFASIVVRRAGIDEPIERRLEVEGFRQTPPSDLAGAAVIVGLATILLMLFMSPIAQALTWTGRRVAIRLKETSSAQRHGTLGFAVWMLHGLRSLLSEEVVPGRPDGWMARLVPYLMFLAISAAFTVLAFGQPLLAPDYDLAVFFLSGSMVLVTVGLVLGGWKGGGHWSLFAGIGTAFHIVTSLVPSVLAIGAIVIVTGSVRLSDIVSAQGGLPWRWHAFASPALLCSFFLFFTPSIAETSRAPADLPEADSAPDKLQLRHGLVRYLMFFAEWGNVFVLSGLAAAIFLGGWRLPGVAAAEQSMSATHQVVGALVFQLKCWSLILTVLWLRWALPRLRVEQMVGLVWRWLIPASVLAVGGALLWVHGRQSPFVRACENVLPYVMFAAIAFAVLYFLQAVLSDLRSKSGQVSLNPWL